MIPTHWDLPDEFFNVRITKSREKTDNPTINLCDGLKRKATMLSKHFKTVAREPIYMRNKVLEIGEHGSLPILKKSF